MENGLNSNITYLKGVGTKRAETLQKLGIETVGDLLDYYPRTYLDLSNTVKIREITDGEPAAVRATLVTDVSVKKTGRGGSLTLYSFLVSDGSDTMQITLFNQKYTAEKLMRGSEYIFYGKGEVTGFFRTIKSPLIEFPDNAAILPVYPLSTGVNQKFLRTSTRAALDACSEHIKETLPENIIKKYDSWVYILNHITHIAQNTSNKELLHSISIWLSKIRFKISTRLIVMDVDENIKKTYYRKINSENIQIYSSKLYSILSSMPYSIFKLIFTPMYKIYTYAITLKS